MTEEELKEIERVWATGWGGWNGPEAPDVPALVAEVRRLRGALDAVGDSIWLSGGDTITIQPEARKALELVAAIRSRK